LEIPDKIKNIKIFIIDDAASVRSMTSTILCDAGFTNMEEASDGINAFKKLQSSHYDFVICDWTMPNMDGLELLDTVRKNEKLKSISFLMATSVSDATSVKAAIQFGVTDYITKITKPFAYDILCQKIVKALVK